MLGFVQYGPYGERRDFGVTFKLAIKDVFGEEGRQEFGAGEGRDYNGATIVDVSLPEPVRVDPGQKATIAVTVHKGNGNFYCGINTGTNNSRGDEHFNLEQQVQGLITFVADASDKSKLGSKHDTNGTRVGNG